MIKRWLSEDIKLLVLSSSSISSPSDFAEIVGEADPRINS